MSATTLQRFRYQAFDLTGKASSGTLDATDAAEATEALRRQGLYASEIRPAAAGDARGPALSYATPSAAAGGARRRMWTGRKLKNLAMFTRQMSVLVSSGTPVVQALNALERQSKDAAWRQVVAGVRDRVEQGSTLAHAMEDFPDVFDPVCRSLIAAGESSGSFDKMLDRLASLTRKQKQTRSAIIGALIYPTLLIVVAAAVLGLMMLFVLPRFAVLFESLDVALPPTTQMLMTGSDAVKAYWWAMLLGLGGAGYALWLWSKSEAGSRRLDGLLLAVPLLGGMVKGFAVARITRVLGVLVTGRVPLLEALSLARQTCGNSRFVDLVARAEEAVTRGGSMSAAFSSGNLVSPSLCEAIKSGESSGQMGPLLLNIADFQDEENETVVKSLTSILEPLILVALGAVVGFVALSMFLPLFDLTSAAGGGK